MELWIAHYSFWTCQFFMTAHLSDNFQSLLFFFHALWKDFLKLLFPISIFWSFIMCKTPHWGVQTCTYFLSFGYMLVIDEEN